MNEGGWRVRASACELLALSLRYPTYELAQAVHSGEWLEAASEIADALRMALPDGFEREPVNICQDGEEAADADALLHALRAEATRLFVGAPEPMVSPYEGIWRAADDNVAGLLFVNPHSMEVERYMRACGFGRPEGTNEPLDHVATEIELMEYLAAFAAGVALPEEGSPAPAELPGGSPQAAYAQFAGEHLLTWAPRFAAKLASETRLPFYRVVAELLAGFVFLSRKAG